MWGQVASIVLVAALWGCTNPLLKRASEEGVRDVSSTTNDKNGGALRADSAVVGGDSKLRRRRGSSHVTPSPPVEVPPRRAHYIVERAHEMWRVVSNWKFFVPFALNQSGSAVFYALLGTSNVSLVVPAANSLTFVFTAVTGHLLGEDSLFTPRAMVGTVLVVTGIALCLHAQAQGCLAPP